MDEANFDIQLGRLFSECSPFADEPAFAERIESRLSREWALRRFLIFAAGVVGGLIAVAQMTGSGLWERLATVTRLLRATRQGVRHLPLLPQFSILADMPLGAEVAWLVVGLAVLAAALWAGRSLENI